MDTLHLLQQRPHLHEVLKLTYCISDVYAHSIFMSVQTIAWGLQLTITLIMIKSDDYLHNLFIALMVYKMLKVARNSWTLSNLQKYISDLLVPPSPQMWRIFLFCLVKKRKWRMLISISKSPNWHLKINYFVQLTVQNPEKKEQQKILPFGGWTSKCFIFFAIKRLKWFICYPHDWQLIFYNNSWEMTCRLRPSK